MKKHGGDGLLGKGAISGFDLCEKARSRPYNGRGEGVWNFLFSLSTVTPLHDANDYNDGDACMVRIFLYSIVCFQDI